MYLTRSHGSVKHVMKKDEPIKQLLGNIESSLVQKILANFYDGDETKVPSIEYISGLPPCLSTEICLPGVE